MRQPTLGQPEVEGPAGERDAPVDRVGATRLGGAQRSRLGLLGRQQRFLQPRDPLLGPLDGRADARRRVEVQYRARGLALDPGRLLDRVPRLEPRVVQLGSRRPAQRPPRPSRRRAQSPRAVGSHQMHQVHRLILR